MRYHLAGIAALAFLSVPAAADELAARFAARPAAMLVSLSPSGQKIVYTTAYKTRGQAIMVADTMTGTASTVIASADPDLRPSRCAFKNETRLICTIYGTIHLGATTLAFTRVAAIDITGKNLKLLTQRQNSRVDASFDGGALLDMLPDDPRHVLMQTSTGSANGGEDYSGGTNIKRPEPGVGAALVDVDSGTQTNVERSSPTIGALASDEHGNIRLRIMKNEDADGYLRSNAGFSLRAKGSREWLPLARVDLGDARHQRFFGFDAGGTAAYVLKSLDGRQALYSVAADGSNTATLVYAHPAVDVDGVVRIGKYARPVGAEYALDRDEVHYFDATLDALSRSLAKALPGHPGVTIVDESWDGSKKLIYADAANVPGHYYLYDAATRKLGELAAVYPGFDGEALGRVSPVNYPARDGTIIPGFLTLPPGRTDAKGLPAIVLPHGGPAARDTAGFDWLAQFFAAQGFAVLQPNFRGSTGYGDAFFAKNGFQSWQLAIGDVNDGARWLVAQGVPATRLAIFGWSYGGYAALQANVVDPGLYRAVVAVAPVTDLPLMRTEARNSYFFKQIDTMIGNGPHVLAGSPAHNAARVAAPVLMFHADRDLNVDIEQSRTMVAALKAAGKKVELIEYKGLDHQIDDSDARADLLTRSAAFLKAATN